MVSQQIKIVVYRNYRFPPTLGAAFWTFLVALDWAVFGLAFAAAAAAGFLAAFCVFFTSLAALKCLHIRINRMLVL